MIEWWVAAAIFVPVTAFIFFVLGCIVTECSDSANWPIKQ